MPEENKETNILIIQGKGKTKEEAFSSIAKALFSKMVNINSVQPQKNAKLKVTATSLDELLTNYLNEILKLKKEKGMFYSQFRTKIIESINDKGEKVFALEGVVFGEKITLHKEKLGISEIIKNKTKILQEKDVWICESFLE